MTPIRIPCPHCARVATLDAERIPDHPVAFSCPGCQGSVTVDKARLMGNQAAPAPAAPTAPRAGAPTPDARNTPAPRPEAPATRAPAPGPADRTSAPAAAAMTRGDEELILLEIPEGAPLPGGFLFTEQEEVAAELQRALTPYSCALKRFDDLELLCAHAAQQMPELIVYVARSVTSTPFAPLEPLRNLPMVKRRRIFVLLISDDLPSMAGNVAFFHQVDLTLGVKHLHRAAEILYTGLQQRQLTHKNFLECLDRQAI